MSETNPETQPEVKQLRPDTLDNPAKDTGRYAAFRTDLGQYVGGVHSTKAKAQAAGKARAGDDAPLIVQEV